MAKDADKGFGQGSACLNKGRDIKISGTVADTSSLMNWSFNYVLFPILKVLYEADIRNEIRNMLDKIFEHDCTTC